MQPPAPSPVDATLAPPREREAPGTVASLGSSSARAIATAAAPTGYAVTTLEEATVSATGSSSRSFSSVAPPSGDGGSGGDDAATPELAPGPAPTPSPEPGPAPIAGPDPAPPLTLAGTAGDDRFELGLEGQDRFVFGGEGHDTAVFAASRETVLRTVGPFGDAPALRLERPDGGTDMLVAVERLEFEDGTYLLDLAGHGEDLGYGYRLYAAAFGRTPDEPGLRHWLGELAGGMARDALADAFVASEEFQEQLGDAATDEDFVTGLYRRVLLREPDAAGLSYWLDRLSGHGFDQGDVLAFFSESEENVARTAPDLELGVLVL